MNLRKLFLTVVGAAMLLGALASSASARNWSLSSQTWTALWRRMNFAGGIGGSVECELKLSGSFHARTFTKTVNSLVGYITEGSILRCARGNMTINQTSFPWHLRYRGFAGTLPNITSISDTFTGAEWTVREPGGISCTVTNATSIRTFTLSAGTVTKVSLSGTSVCGGFFTGTISGEETNITNGSGARLTITLI